MKVHDERFARLKVAWQTKGSYLCSAALAELATGALERLEETQRKLAVITKAVKTPPEN